MPPIELFMRLVIIALSLTNIAWSWRGPVQFSRGNFVPPYFAMSFVFFANLTTLSYEAWHFVLPGDSLWRLLLLTLSIITGAIGVFAWRSDAPLMTNKFHLIYKALPQALAIATLAEYDRAAADRVADECWGTIRERVTAGVDPDHGE